MLLPVVMRRSERLANVLLVPPVVHDPPPVEAEAVLVGRPVQDVVVGAVNDPVRVVLPMRGRFGAVAEGFAHILLRPAVIQHPPPVEAEAILVGRPVEDVVVGAADHAVELRIRMARVTAVVVAIAKIVVDVLLGPVVFVHPMAVTPQLGRGGFTAQHVTKRMPDGIFLPIRGGHARVRHRDRRTDPPTIRFDPTIAYLLVAQSPVSGLRPSGRNPPACPRRQARLAGWRGGAPDAVM